VILKLKVQDVDAQEKFKFVKKVLKERAFLEAIKKENDEDKIDITEVNDMLVNKSSYNFIEFSFFTKKG